MWREEDLFSFGVDFPGVGLDFLLSKAQVFSCFGVYWLAASLTTRLSISSST
jgi:hypothetical protein